MSWLKVLIDVVFVEATYFDYNCACVYIYAHSNNNNKKKEF